MAPKLGYLLPTREQIMEGKPDVASLLALAARAEAEGYDSVWVGDSVLARPRHDPLTLLAGVAGRVPRVELGTAVLLPALRNPVLLAHQVATIDQISEGRLILGVGFAADVPNIRAEFAACGVPFDKRIGRMMDGLRLCRALWTGQPVDWEGRWPVHQGVLAPTPYRAGGPPLWIGGNLPTSLERAGKFFDGWFPVAPAADAFATGLAQVRSIAAAAGRVPASVTGAMYVTIALDDDAAKANDRLMRFLGAYYAPQPAEVIRKRQACYAGPVQGVAAYLEAYAQAGVTHFCVRFAGDHETQMTALAKVRATLGW
ncbi:MAG: LLM class flavin-dependent oxidoreductase [Acetobacteraceae bacterium]|jgi:alkanesulfonate monooxygenase SsuD/methylene tetrahydromethanopterin reductase-like flavin-dependent oxidoreductase (luciferase family)